MQKKSRGTLRLVNNGLTILVVGLCLYLLLAPFWPKATFVIKSDPPLAKNEKVIPDQNTLVIPTIKLQETIHEGNETALRIGLWHRPSSSTPENGGNTVLTGHRFTYGGPAVLYHLDKVRIGDDVTMYWDHKKYTYQVSEVLVVSPRARNIEAQTSEPTLTIYTCTPLITAKNRLVIRAVPVGESE